MQSELQIIDTIYNLSQLGGVDRILAGNYLHDFLESELDSLIEDGVLTNVDFKVDYFLDEDPILICGPYIQDSYADLVTAIYNDIVGVLDRANTMLSDASPFVRIAVKYNRCLNILVKYNISCIGD